MDLLSNPMGIWQNDRDFYVVTAASIFSPLRTPLYHMAVDRSNDEVGILTAGYYSSRYEVLLRGRRDGKIPHIFKSLEVAEEIKNELILQGQQSSLKAGICIESPGVFPIMVKGRNGPFLTSRNLVKVRPASYFMWYWKIMRDRSPKSYLASILGRNPIEPFPPMNGFFPLLDSYGSTWAVDGSYSTARNFPNSILPKECLT